MSSRSVKILALAVVVLFGILYALNSNHENGADTDKGLLVPDLKEHLNDLESIDVTDSKGPLAIQRADGAWRVKEKQGYPADTALLRQLLLGLAEARKIERKTANPELYAKLGVQHPVDDGGEGLLVAGKGGDFAFSVILGKPAQDDYRYARIPDDEQSWLIDRSPDLPESSTGWLESQIVDLKTTEVQSVEIRHADGETIRIRKDAADTGTFDVEGIPEGRELSYPTVVNSIAGALANLTLEDVAAVETGDGAFAEPTAATYETFDGLRIEIAAGEIGDGTWITLTASVAPREAAPADATAAETAGETAGKGPADDAGAATDESKDEPAAGPADDDAGEGKAEGSGATPEARAAAINGRTNGWRYRIASYKADQLTRRWEDLLKAEDTE